MNKGIRSFLLALVMPALAVAQPPEETQPPAAMLQSGAPGVGNEESVGLPPALARVHPAWRDFEPEWRSQPCPFAPRMDFDKERVECGFVLVPENRRDPDSRLIRLSVARVAADGDDPPAGTSVYLQGGPGGPAMQSAALLVSSTSERGRQMRDVSHWLFPDQRGVGFSEPYFCRGVYSYLADEVPYSEAGRARFHADLRECLDNARARGIDVSAYTTWDNAMDMRDIRRALGLAQWNLYGISYGTELGQMVLRVDAEGTRSAVLDSVVASPPNSWDRFSLGMESALSALDRACKVHGECNARFGGLEQRARRAVDAYRERPLVVEDVDPYVSPSGVMNLNHHLSAWGIFQALYLHNLYPALPAMIEAWAEADAELIRAYVEQLARSAGPDVGYGLQYVANCSGSARMLPEQRDAVGRERPYWSEALVDGHVSDVCTALGLDNTDPLLVPLRTDVPVLVAAGSVDPITPPDYAEAILPGLENATYVELPYTGHGATLQDCGAAILGDFLADPERAPDTSCIDEMEPPDFVTDYKPTRGPLRLANAVRDGRYMALAWVLAPTVVLLGAVFAFPLAAVGRRVDSTGVLAPRPRWFAWLAAVLAVGGIALLAMAFQQTVATAAALVPLGLIGPTGWAAAALALALLAAVAALWSLRASERTLATTVGVLLTVLSVVLVFAFTVQRGLVF